MNKDESQESKNIYSNIAKVLSHMTKSVPDSKLFSTNSVASSSAAAYAHSNDSSVKTQEGT